MPPSDRTLRVAALPFVAGVGAFVPLGPSAVAVVPETITYTVPNSTDLRVQMKTYTVSTPPASVIPLSVDTFIPAATPIAHAEDYFDIDFGEPDPFIVPSAWVEQFSSVNPGLGEQGRFDEESE